MDFTCQHSLILAERNVCGTIKNENMINVEGKNCDGPWNFDSKGLFRLCFIDLKGKTYLRKFIKIFLLAGVLFKYVANQRCKETNTLG